MCAECGCMNSGLNHLQFTVTGYTEESAASAEKALLSLPGVYHVHVHAHDGETTIDYDPAKTKFLALMGEFDRLGLSPQL